MNAAEHRTLRSNLGAYALGQLAPDEARVVEEHLATCGICRAEHDELLPVAGALADLRGSMGRSPAERSTPSGVDLHGRDDVAAPPHLEDRVVHSVRAAALTERRPTWLRSAALLVAGAAAASAVLAATVGFDDDTEAVTAVPLEAVDVLPRAPGVAAEADLVAHTWGVEVKLTATGFDEGDRYRVLVLGEDGRTYPAGGFVGTGTAEMRCNLNSTVLRDSASGFEVRDAQGRVVATSSFEA